MKYDVAELHRAVVGRLADAEQQYTTNRRIVVETLAGAARPLTLPDLLRRSPSLAQSSAYRSLTILMDAGVVRRLSHGADHGHYELAEQLTQHHHHLICDGCGSVADVTLPDHIEHAMDDSFVAVAELFGFVPERHAVDIFGRCEQCR